MANEDSSGTSAERSHLKRIAEGALADLHRGRADLAREPIAELLRALPDDASVRNLAVQAAVIGFDYPLQRSAAEPGPRPPPSPASIDLVAFHVDLPRAPSGVHQAIDYSSVLQLSFEAAAIKAPNARRILLTDEATALPAGLRVDEVMRFPLDPAALMYERMRVQSLYLARRETERSSVLMDSDVVVNAEPSPIFAEVFDVGLTWRRLRNAEAPLNGGVIFVGEGSGGGEFFRKARACYDALVGTGGVAAHFQSDLRAWWGDQFALAATVGYRAYSERTTDLLSVDGVRVRLFPAETHNFTIEAGRSNEELKQKFFVHFKGNRKALQASYVEALRAGRF